MYKVGLTVAAPLHDEATAESAITIRAYAPPSGTLQLSEPEVLVGGHVTLTANFAPGQCGGALHPAVFAASEGSISGNQFDSSGVQFDPETNTAQQKTVTITATVADDKVPQRRRHVLGEKTSRNACQAVAGHRIPQRQCACQQLRETRVVGGIEGQHRER